MDDRIEVPLDLDGFTVAGSEVTGGRLEVSVRSTTRPACSHCGSLDVCVHAINERRIRDRSCSLPTTLLWHQRRLMCGISRQQNPRFIPEVWRSRGTFMKRAHKLTVEERAALDAIFELIPEIGVAWLLKEEFAAIYEAPDRTEAERRLEVWIDHIIGADLPEFTNIWRALQWWVEPILAHFDDRVTNAFAEGITNKIKVMKRRSYGFRNPVRYRHKVLLSCRRRGSRHG